MQNLTIDGQRLWNDIQDTAAFGACEGGGVTRLTLSDEDRHVRDWFRAAAEAQGCVVTVDGVGNMFARRAGKRADLDPIAIGSHLDTQPTGGKFDGVLGVLAGLEILRTLNAMDYVTNAPIEVVNWTNEEGSRFAPAILASGVFAGVFAEDWVLSQRDREGITFGEALDAIGYRGNKPVSGHRLGAMFELHIEQGPILEREDVPIGVVTGVQGARWYDVTLIGSAGHTGATPMPGRRNALLGAARVIEAADRIAADHGPDVVATVGSLDVLPNSRNVIPGEVRFTADLRTPDDGVLAAMAAAFERSVAEIAAELGLKHEVKLVLDSPATHFDPALIAHVEQGAAQAGLGHRRIVAGAQHDAVHVARVAPTTMIFVPCREGISHNVAEFASLEHCAAGTQVMLNAVLALDEELANARPADLRT